MRKEKRWIKLLELLAAHTDGLTGEVLATRLDVSARTVRSDIRAISEQLQEIDGVELAATPNRGYRLKTDLSVEEVRGLLASKGLEKKGKAGSSKHLIRLFLEALLKEVSVTQAELAEEMYVSLTTFKEYLAEARKTLAGYDVGIAKVGIEGMRLSGDEWSLRRVLLDFVIEEEEDGILHGYLFRRTKREVLQEIVRKSPSIRSLQLTDKAAERLLYQTAISIYRTSCGRGALLAASSAGVLEESFEYSAAKDFAAALLHEGGLDIPHSEIYYLTQCLMTGKKLLRMAGEVNDARVGRIVDALLVKVDGKYGFQFSKDQYLRDGLILHLRIAIARVNFHIHIRNELLATIKGEYPLAFQIALYAAKILRDEEHVQFDEDEIGYMALHFGASMTRNSTEETSAKRVYVICAAGLGVSIFLKAKLKEHFRDRIQVLDVLPASQFSEELLTQADFILSTVALPHASEKIIRISHMLKAKDIKTLEDHLFRVRDRALEEFVRGLFSKELFFTGKRFGTKEESLDFLCREAIARGIMDEEGRASVYEREEMSSTAIGDFVAIPHSLLSSGYPPSISVLLLDAPVQWDEEFQARLIFLLNIDQAQAKLWEQVFLKLYTYIKENDGIVRLLRNPSYEYFIEDLVSIV
ncbi:transcriptional regulator LicR [Selenomonas sp. TAMA-11512]|uniref:BglG family transcription antiterminator n=1 Tax=Selenomonas sp. TAMA-11512 TaxID=3095337 RepID=UPI0030851EC7|nr:transcriptional regulator LicR [Selenomonas sp. TAMA-11512]